MKERRRPPTEDLYDDETLDQKLPDLRPSASPDAHVLRGDDERTLRVALQRIPEKMRAALVLRYYRHLDYQEIANTMSVTLGNVKTLIHRGKAALARELSARGASASGGDASLAEVHTREVLCV